MRIVRCRWPQVLALLVLVAAAGPLPARALPASAAASDYYVSPSGSDSNAGTPGAPFRQISHAASLVQPGGTVHVAPGQYLNVTSSASGTSSARIRFVSDTKWGALISNGAEMGWYNKGDYVDIVGFEITGNSRIGIYNSGNYATIMGNHIHGTQQGSYGSNGGAAIGSGNYGAGFSTTGNHIIGNYIHNNGIPGVKSSTQGHGIYPADANCVVQNNVVINNSGIGITLWHAATAATISNNLLIGNLDGGIEVGAGDSPGGVTCDHCLVSNNISINNQGYGIQEFGAVGPNNVYLNNCLYGNGTGQTSLQGGKVAQNTVTPNAKFVNYQSDGSGDYHLAVGSPCIDAGTFQGAPATDFDGASRPQGAADDIGPYEFVTAGAGSGASGTSSSSGSGGSEKCGLLGIELLAPLGFLRAIRRGRRRRPSRG